MTTIAEHIDNFYAQQPESYAEDIYYLHVPRAIVKMAEDIDVPAEGAMDVIPSDLLGKGVTWVSNAALPAPPPGDPRSHMRYFVDSNFGGNGISSGILDSLAEAQDPRELANLISLWTESGANLPEVASIRMHGGEASFPKFVSNLGKYTGNEAATNAGTELYNYVSPESSFVGPSGVAAGMRRGMRTIGLATPNRTYKNNAGYANKFNSRYTPEQRAQMVQEYNDAVKAEIDKSDYDNTFYGWFSDPQWRNAARYAAPWLMYGVPLSVIGSLTGNHGLWGPTLLGAVGAGAYGYASEGDGWLKDFSKGTVGQFLDNVTTMANTPAAWAWNALEPATGRVMKKILTEPKNYDTPPEKPAPAPDTNKGTPVARYNTRFGTTPYVQGQKRVVKAPELLQLPNYDTPENDFNSQLSLS